MQKINKWEDVSQFSGKTVAYTTNSIYFQDDDNFHISNSNHVSYGIVSNNPSEFKCCYSHDGIETGYKLRRIKLYQNSSTCALINYEIKLCNDLHMRLVTEQEKTILINGLKLNKCKIEYNYDNDSCKLIQ